MKPNEQDHRETSSTGGVSLYQWSLVADRVSDESVLADDELARASRFKFNKHREAFIAARVGLRKLLAGYLQISPEAVGFRYGTFGKPCLAACESHDLRFNLSHSNNQALAIIAEGSEVGVDIERVPEQNKWSQAVAKRCFHSNELAQLANKRSKKEQLEAFYRLWTRKEAVVKLLGAGLQMPLTEFQVSAESKMKAWIDLPRENPLGIERCWVESLDVDDGYVAAFASEQHPVQVTSSSID